MKIHLLAVGVRMPAWVQTAYAEYAARLPRECPLYLREIPLGQRRSGADPVRAIQIEGERLLTAAPAGSRMIVLDERGQQWSTVELAEQLANWQQEGRDVSLLIGGPDGLAAACRERAERLWSLSRLTLPHLLVRVVVAEQLYRAWSLLRHHPYHRA